ncbi:response regulator transcription factor [Hungatella hathewayi]|uniref:response regulator transcription factor n=1 Tax=Hungatella hathewayi TaxID=154046 RepID=UPI003561E9A7
MKRSILVISNEHSICTEITNAFASSYAVVFCVKSSVQALEMIMKNTYSLIIFDSLIHDMNGNVMLQIIRQLCRSPILVLTRQYEIDNRMKMLDLGADDCLVWPASVEDLIVRAEVCLKKGIHGKILKPVIVKDIALFIDPGKRSVEINQRGVILTRREFDILYLLASAPGVVFSKEEIYAEIWEDKFVKDESNIMSHIGRLRKKLGQEAGAYIETVWGIGYRFGNKRVKE